MTANANLQELYTKFDCTGPDGNTHLAWYGQERAAGLTHDEAIASTYEHFKWWCNEIWPKRGIPIPETQEAAK